MEQILFLPFLVSLLSFVIPNKIVKDFSLAFALVYFIFSLLLVGKIDVLENINFIYYHEFLKDMGGSLYLGLDGLGYLMLLLTNFIVLIVNMLAYNKSYPKQFYGLVFLMQFALIGVFSSLNAILFYIFWELALLPIYIILVKWGSGEKLHKTFTEFFLYTFVGSLFILAGFIYLYTTTHSITYDLKNLIPMHLEGNEALIFTLCMTIGFGVKIPMFLLHSWQADTYTKAPAEGTILLSGIMLKMGLFGWLRWGVPFQESINPHLKLVLILICVLGVLYGAYIALRRDDMKRIIAFSSLSHVNLILAGILTLVYSGFQGSVLQMVVHGINVAGLFYVIDLIEQQTQTRDLTKLGGIASRSPYFATMAFIIVLGSMAVPLTNGFPGEFMLLYSVFSFNTILGIVAGISIIIGAAYLLRFYQLSFFGETTEYTANFKPIGVMDKIALGMISFLVITLGIMPQQVLKFTEFYAQYLVNLLEIKL